MLSCYIGLGSNIEHPSQQIVRAITELASLPSSEFICASSLYRSKPMGPQDQPDFINAVAKLKTSLPALSLLFELQKIESLHNRVRSRHWGPRSLDLDLLLYGEQEIESDALSVPHPEMAHRNFVLIPLYEIAAELTIPVMGQLAHLVKQIDREGLELVSSHE